MIKIKPKVEIEMKRKYGAQREKLKVGQTYDLDDQAFRSIERKKGSHFEVVTNELKEIKKDGKNNFKH